MDDIIIVGAGIGGLTLGLALHAAGIPCRIFESAADWPFGQIHDVISCDELVALSGGYKRIAGYSKDALRVPNSS